MPEGEPDPATFAWLYETYIAGGVSATSDQAVIDLKGGEYGVWADEPTSPFPATPLTVTGDPDAPIEGPEPEVALPSSKLARVARATHSKSMAS